MLLALRQSCMARKPALQRSDVELMLRCLRGLSVLQGVQQGAADSQQPRYGMHLLVRGQAAQVQRRQPEDQQTAALTGFIDHILSVGKRLASLARTAANAVAATDLIGLEVLNMQAMLQLMAGPDSPGALTMLQDVVDKSGLAARRRDSIDLMAYALSHWGQPRLALEATRTAYEARKLRPDEEATLRSLTNLCCTLSEAGLHQEAMIKVRQVLAAMQRVLGPEHPDALNSLSNLSIWLAQLGQHQEAVDMARQALAAQQRVLGRSTQTRCAA